MTCHFYIITYFSNCVWSLFMWPNRDGKWEGVERRGVGWGGESQKPLLACRLRLPHTQRGRNDMPFLYNYIF